MGNMSTGWKNTLGWANEPFLQEVRLREITSSGYLKDVENIELKQYIINLATYQMITMARLNYMVEFEKGLGKCNFAPVCIEDAENQYTFDSEGWGFIMNQCDHIKYDSHKEELYKDWIQKYEDEHRVNKPCTTWVSQEKLKTDKDAKTFQIIG